MKFKTRHYQEVAIRETMKCLSEVKKVGAIMPTGCLTGDTIIHTNRAGMGRPYTLRRLFNSHNGNPDKIPYLKRFRKDITTYVRSFDGEKIRLNEVLGVVYSGKKAVFTIMLENGLRLTGTACHPIMTKRGFVSLGQLITGADEVMCDDMTCQGVQTKKRKPTENMIVNLWHHPFARAVDTVKAKRGFTKRLEKHRAIYEAVLNHLSLEEYVNILRNDQIRAATLKYINPGQFHIHHKDGNHYNNEPSNLEALAIKDHLTHHQQPENFGQGVPTFSKIIMLQSAGEQDTYDIQCKAPHHNFVANGMVVHNSGKTEVFIGVATEFLALNPGKSVLILSHLSLLTVQTKARFLSRAPHIKVGVLQAQIKPPPDAQVIVSTMQSSRVEDKIALFNHRIESDVGLIIVDECHYLGSDSYDKALGYYPNAKVFGVTATPFRERRIMTSTFEKISFTISLQELINDGYLVEPKLHQITHQSETVDDLIALMVKTYQEKEKGNKAIVFMQTIEDAKALRNAFADNHISAEAVTSEMIGENRDDVLSRFNTGDIDILTTVNVLTAGFDAPNVRAIFMPYATSSPTMYMQRIGRGLRPFEGKTECRVYVVGDAPSISRQTYEKIHRDALNGTADWKSCDTLTDDLAFNFPDKTSEVYLWTVQAVAIAERLENLGLRSISKMLVEKKFPKKFMGNLVEISKALEHVAPTAEQFKTPYITVAQAEKLQRYGFAREGIDKLTKTEGSMLIAAMVHMFQEQGPYVVKSGKFAGKHVANIPYQYKMIVMQKFPNSEVARLIRQWNQEKRA